MSTTRNTQSFDAGAAAFAAGMARSTYVDPFFCDLKCWQAGWDDAAYMAQQNTKEGTQAIASIATGKTVRVTRAHRMSALRQFMKDVDQCCDMGERRMCVERLAQMIGKTDAENVTRACGYPDSFYFANL